MPPPGLRNRGMVFIFLYAEKIIFAAIVCFKTFNIKLEALKLVTNELILVQKTLQFTGIAYENELNEKH